MNFVPFDIAKSAKEKGFDEFCRAAYENNTHTNTVVFLDYFETAVLTIEDVEKILEVLKTRPGLLKASKNSTFPPWLIAAPTFEELIDWFRKKHIRIVESLDTPSKNCWVMEVDGKCKNKKLLSKYVSTCFHTGNPPRYLSLEKAIKKALKLL